MPSGMSFETMITFRSCLILTLQPIRRSSRRSKTLAGLSRFVIAYITDARRVPHELLIIDTHCRTVAVRLIKKRGEPEYGMLDFRNSPWFVKGRYEYENAEELIASIKENVIGPAKEKVKELRQCN
jgi:hypothetical protein